MGLPGSYVIATENSYVGSLVALAGGENVYEGSTEEFLTVNTEDMKNKEPDIILRTAHALPDQVMEMFNEDFATVNPYLGTDGIKPFVDVCKEEKKGLFILVKTSNPSSGDFQDQMVGDRPVYELVGEKVAQWGETCMGDDYSYVGAVVGATYPEMGKTLRKIMPKAYILVPGYGAQGGQGKDLVHFFNEDGLGAIVNSSRGIIAAYKQEKYAKFGEENFADASRAAAEDMIADITGALEAAK